MFNVNRFWYQQRSTPIRPFAAVLLDDRKKDWLVEFDGDISIDMAGLRPMLDEQPTERWEDSWEDGNAGSKKLWWTHLRNFGDESEKDSDL